MFKKVLSYIFPIRLFKSSSQTNDSIEVTLYNGELILDSKNVNYSYGSLQKVLRFGLKKIGYSKIKKMQNILILGVAGGSVVKTLVDEIQFEGKIKGVEIDQKIIDVANTYFGLDKILNLEIVIDDAKEFVKTDKTKYDLIILDVFQDNIMPDFLFENEFSNNLISLLNPEGIILFNTMKTSKKEAERNQNFISRIDSKNCNVMMFSEVERYNELIIITKRLK